MKTYSIIKRQKQLKNIVKPTNPRPEFFAFLGNLQGVVEADDNGMVYITDFDGHVSTAYNQNVPPIPRRAVKVGYSSPTSKLLEVLRFVDSYPQKRIPSVSSHSPSHTWGSWDPVWIRTEQILTCLATPGTGLTITFVGLLYYLNGYHLLNNQTIDLSVYAVTDGARWVLVEADENKVISFQFGVVVDGRGSLAYEQIPIPSSGKFPLFAVKMYFGQTSFVKEVSNTDIIGLLWAGRGAGGGGVDYISDTATIEALTTATKGQIAYAIDTNRFGSYNGSFWQWEGINVGRYAPSNLFQGMMWFDTTGMVPVALDFSTSDNSMYIPGVL